MHQAINSGEHAIFPFLFLEKQNRCTDVTLAQMDKVTEHLEKVEVEIAEVQVENSVEVRAGLRELYSHPKPLIADT